MSNSNTGPWGAIILVVCLFIAALIGVIGWLGGYTRPEGGQVIVVRNGGMFDSKDIRQVIPENAGRTWAGFWSEEHPYPASTQQRIYKFDDAKDADAKPVEVPSKDGVRVRLTGTFYINTAFDGTPQGDRLLTQFDTAFGTRKFGSADSDSDDAKKPWEDGGWSLFLNSVLQPVIDSNIREVIAEFDCKQLVSSCALVQRGGRVRVEEVRGENNASNVQQIQDRINENLAQEILAKLGGAYFKNIRFSLGPVELPGVQQAIDTAQSAFAKVSEAQARVEQAKQDRLANKEKQKGYNSCPSCARQDELKALPANIQTLVFGSGAPVAIGGNR